MTRAHPHDFSTALHELLANTQRELDEIKPPFVRDMRQKAPHVFKMVERRRAALIERHFGKLFVEGQRAGMVRKDIPAKLIIEILLAMVQAIMNPPKMEELGMTPKEGFTGIHQDRSRRRAYPERTESMNASRLVADFVSAVCLSLVSFLHQQLRDPPTRTVSRAMSKANLFTSRRRLPANWNPCQCNAAIRSRLAIPFRFG